MNIAKLIVGLLILTVSPQIFANNWYDRGNGGFVLACGDQPLMVLDLYEAKNRYFLNVLPSRETETQQKALELIARLKLVDPTRAKLYSDWLKSFYVDSQILTDTEFMETPDLGLVKKPKDCTLEQVIFQREPSRLNPARYIVNKALWERLDSDNRAALIVHELIYRDFLSGMSLESTSERIRLFNALILGDKLATIPLPEYIALLQEDLHLSTYTYQGVTLFLGATDGGGRWRSTPVSFHENGKISQASFATNQLVRNPGLRYFCMSSEDTPSAGTISFNENGFISQLRMSEESEASALCGLPSVDLNYEDTSITVSGSRLVFDKLGRISTIFGTTAKSMYSHINYKGWSFERKMNLGVMPASETYFAFDSDQNLREISLGGRPCAVPGTKLIRFQPESSSRLWTVLMNKDGKLETKLNSCDI